MNRGFRKSGFGNVARSLEKMIAAAPACETCGGIGLVLDMTRRPADVPCPTCNGATEKSAGLQPATELSGLDADMCADEATCRGSDDSAPSDPVNKILYRVRYRD